MVAKKSSKLHDKLHTLLRLALGWTMFWGFIDKLFGLGFTTKPESAWLNGGSPTAGFLKFGTHGPFSEVFQSLSGQAWVDWLFMLGLLGIGVAFLLGIAMRFAGYMGALMMLFMYLALIPPEHNPIVDDHLINAIAFVLIGNSNAGEMFGFQKQWQKSSLAKSLPFLK